jgi:signal transduction histidine kinase
VLLTSQNLLEGKKNFVRYISHEIRTPLNTVVMGIQLARKQLTAGAIGNEGEADGILADVEESCVTAVDILNDILLYDKIEDGRMELDKTETTALALVTKTSKIFEVQASSVLVAFRHVFMSDISQAKRTDITLITDFDAPVGLAILHIDVNKCSQVLRNLVSNALKFTPAGGTVKLVAKLVTALDEPVTFVDESSNCQDINFRFEVHDTGPGISKVSLHFV